MKTPTILLLLPIASAASLLAQESPKLTFDLGAGFTESIGATRTDLEKTGWNVEAGGGVHLGGGLGIKLDLGYDYLSVNTATLNGLGAPNGSVTVFSALVNPVYHLPSYKGTNFYVTGGGGYFHQSDTFDAPNASVAVANPFFGFYGPSSGLTSAYSVNKPGYDVGGGFEFALSPRAKVFIEARYDHMFNSPSHTDFIPVTVGWRW
jgi:hypothetical protein